MLRQALLNRPVSRPLSFLAVLLSLLCTRAAWSQNLARQPTAFTAYLDFRQPSQELPIWIERVEKQTVDGVDAAHPGKTIYRFRFRRFAGLVDELLLRVYFDDVPGGQPSISGWAEIGTRILGPEKLGEGVGLPSSQTVRIRMGGVDYIEIEAPGDARNLRGALAVVLQKTETRQAVDFGGAASITDPFGNSEAAVTGTSDLYLFGRVKATLEPGIVPLGEGPDAGQIEYDFSLAKAPAIALVTFEILNADISAPPQLSVNGKDIGVVNLAVSDLADPALTGAIEAARPDAVYRYAGWLKCQKVVPGSLLTAGSNAILITTPGRPQPVALRAISVQLKYTPDATAP